MHNRKVKQKNKYSRSRSTQREIKRKICGIGRKEKVKNKELRKRIEGEGHWNNNRTINRDMSDILSKKGGREKKFYFNDHMEELGR